MPNRQRHILTVFAACLIASSLSARAAEPEAVPGACYVLALKSDKTRLVDRIEVQEVAIRAAGTTTVTATRVRIGIAPRGGDDLIPSDLSAPCQRTGARLTCELRCDDATAPKPLGAFRIEPASKTSIRLRIDQPLTLNACSAGETPVTLPAALVGKTFTLRRAGASDCFH